MVERRRILCVGQLASALDAAAMDAQLDDEVRAGDANVLDAAARKTAEIRAAADAAVAASVASSTFPSIAAAASVAAAASAAAEEVEEVEKEDDFSFEMTKSEKEEEWLLVRDHGLYSMSEDDDFDVDDESEAM